MANVTPAGNLQVGAAVATLWIGLLYIVRANHWMVIPEEVLTMSPPAITLLAAHLMDVLTGENKK